MSCLRVLGLLAVVATATAAPTGQQAAGASPTEDQQSAASLVWPGLAPSPAAAQEADGRLGRRSDDVQVSVATSTSVEITTVTTSVSSEMGPLPARTGRSQDAERSQEEEQEEQDEEEHEAPGAELEDSHTELEKAAEGEAEVLKSAAGEVGSPAGVTAESAEEGTSASPAVTETEASSTDSSASEGTVTPQTEEQSPEAAAEQGGAAPESATEGSGGTPADPAAEEVGTKGTLIFDLGPSASDELHDLVQQTVLDALMDEGLLSAITADTPVIEAEGSGVVFLEETGSGDGEEGHGRSSPFVSIHF
ncbi:serine/threonine-protein phosphatase 4 regulatory subunit 2-like [Amphibalanus amphitrite]|uniref:serine/threonine-protein phosphatase 4 regulatory subunit 2-like n=1 Tax=Amphibalanus amphitrite TaxID=1232801 RepID=UPI001C8FE8A6|nr:serine/threonine-protein phosphatase 4 regulatory subunit 2-like [Amphibalanus amphitrite]